MSTAWPEVALGDVVTPCSKGDPAQTGSGDFTYIDLSSVDQGSKAISSPSKLPTKDAPSRARQVVRSGDVLVSTVRPNLNAVAWVPVELDGSTASTGFSVLRAKAEDLDSRYLFHWVQAPNFVSLMVKLATGASYPAVSDKIVKDSQIPLPPLAEQRRIAAILDKADEVRAKRKAALETLETLSQAIFIEMFGDPVTNPMGWEEISFSEACPSHLGKMLDQKQQTGLSPKKYLRNANVRWLRFDLADVAEMDFSVSEEAKYRLNPGDVMICEGGEPGRAAVWRGEIEECYFQKALHRARPRPELADPDFIVHLLWLLANGGGLSDHVTSATIAHLTGEKLKRMVVPMPPIRHQQKFADEIGACERQEKRSKSALQDLDNLFSSLQQKAFQGAL